MSGPCCNNCVYCIFDPEDWLRSLYLGEPIVPKCANHPQWPGVVHYVPGVGCENYQPRPMPPEDDSVRLIPLSGGGVGGPSPVQRFRIAAQEFDETTTHQLLLISSLMHILATDTAFRDAVRPIASDALKLRHATNSMRAALPEILALLGDVKLQDRLASLAREVVRAVAEIKVLTSDLHALLRALTDGQHQNNSTDADDHAEHGQEGAQAIGTHRPPGFAQHGLDHVVASRWCGKASATSPS